MSRVIVERPVVIFVFVVVLAVHWNRAAAQDGDGPHIKEHWGEILRWLPVDVETVIAANGPLQIPIDVSGKPTFQKALELLSLEFVRKVHDGSFAKELKGHNVQIVVEGSRRFRAPKALGMMRYEGCQILKFEKSADDALQHAMVTCLEKAPKTIQIGEIKVAVFREKWGADEWSLLFARPRRGILLAATDRKFLEEVLARMNRENRDRALPETLSEWQHVNTDASIWAIRHYRKDLAESDPSSPLRPRGGANVADSMAVGFTFWYDGEIARARYLSGAKNAAQVVAKGWSRPSHKLSPVIKEVELGVVEISMPISSTSKGDDGRMFLFALLAYLGHAVYV